MLTNTIKTGVDNHMHVGKSEVLKMFISKPL